MFNNGRHEADIIETTDEEGKVHLFEKVEEIEVEGQRYALLIYQGSDEEDPPAETEDGYDEEVVVMRIGREDDAEVYEAIDNEEEFERVIQYIEEMNEDEDEDDDEEDDDESHPPHDDHEGHEHTSHPH